MATLRVHLPYHLRQLATQHPQGQEGEHYAAASPWSDAPMAREVAIEVPLPCSLSTMIDVLETTFPALRGTIREPGKNARRPFVRFFIAGDDWSAHALETELPTVVTSGAQPVLVIGALAGG